MKVKYVLNQTCMSHSFVQLIRQFTPELMTSPCQALSGRSSFYVATIGPLYVTLTLQNLQDPGMVLNALSFNVPKLDGKHSFTVTTTLLECLRQIKQTFAAF